jgi:hypothetical protein
LQLKAVSELSNFVENNSPEVSVAFKGKGGVDKGRKQELIRA